MFEDILEFVDELLELMRQDWEKVKEFYKENKTYLYWIIVLLITMQFTDLMSLGASWDRFCRKNNIKLDVQKGGAGNSGDAGAESAPQAEQQSSTSGPPKGSQVSFAKDLIKKAEAKSQSDESRQVDKQLGFFKRMRNKLSLSPGRYGAAGPVFSSLDRIFSYLQGIMSIFTLLLVALGIISIPVFIFLVITYTVFKVLINKFFIL